MSEFASREVGEIAGIRVFTSPDSDVLVPQRLVLPSGITVEAFDFSPHLISSCRQFDLDYLVALVADVTGTKVKDWPRVEASLKQAGLDPKAHLRDYQMAFVLKVALSDPKREGRTGQQANLLQLARLCRLVEASRCEADRDATVNAMLLRIAYQQFWELEGLDSWPRGVMILREMQGLISPEDRYDMNSAFMNLYGLSFDTYIFLSFALFALVTGQPSRRFGVEQLVSSTDYKINPDDAAHFLDLVSSDIDTFAARANDPAVSMKGYELYNLNPLVMWPAIRHRDGGVVVPIPRFLLDRVISGVYYDFLRGLGQAEGNRFSAFFGKAFERYIGLILQMTPGLEVFSGEEIIADGKVCDWVIRDGSRLLLIECKARGIGLRSRITGQESDLRRDLLGKSEGSSLPRGAAQLAESAAYALDHLEVDECVPLLVTLDEIYLSNQDEIPIRSIVSEGAAQMTDGEVPEFQMAGANGVEALCRVTKFLGVNPVAVMLEKVKRTDSRQLDMRNFVARRYAPPNKSIAAHREFMDGSMMEIVSQFVAPTPGRSARGRERRRSEEDN